MSGRASSGDAPVLETDRLALRPITAHDTDALHHISNEPGVRRYLWDDEPVGKTTIRTLVSESLRMVADEGIGLFGVRRRGGVDILGFWGFVQLEGMQEPELAYALTQATWGEGLATEASVACLRHAFEDAGLQRVVAGADPPNAASLRVIEKLGMRFLGSINPTAPDEPYYGLYREEFLAGIRREERTMGIEAKLEELGLELPGPRSRFGQAKISPRGRKSLLYAASA